MCLYNCEQESKCHVKCNFQSFFSFSAIRSYFCGEKIFRSVSHLRAIASSSSHFSLLGIFAQDEIIITISDIILSLFRLRIRINISLWIAWNASPSTHEIQEEKSKENGSCVERETFSFFFVSFSLYSSRACTTIADFSFFSSTETLSIHCKSAPWPNTKRPGLSSGSGV